MIIRLLLLLIVLFLVYTVFQALRQMLTGPPRPPRQKSREGEDMVRDPQCGLYLPRTDAIQATIRGEQRHFCSEECRTQYEQQH